MCFLFNVFFALLVLHGIFQCFLCLDMVFVPELQYSNFSCFGNILSPCSQLLGQVGLGSPLQTAKQSPTHSTLGIDATVRLVFDMQELVFVRMQLRFCRLGQPCVQRSRVQIF